MLGKLPVLLIQLNNQDNFADIETINSRRACELDEFTFSTVPDLVVQATFDNKQRSIQSALFSLYTTIFVIVLLVVCTFFLYYSVITFLLILLIVIITYYRLEQLFSLQM